MGVTALATYAGKNQETLGYSFDTKKFGKFLLKKHRTAILFRRSSRFLLAQMLNIPCFWGGNTRFLSKPFFDGCAPAEGSGLAVVGGPRSAWLTAPPSPPPNPRQPCAPPRMGDEAGGPHRVHGDSGRAI